MSRFNRVLDAARRSRRRVVLPEATDLRVLQAAVSTIENGSAEPILLGKPSEISAIAHQADIDIRAVQIIDPISHPRREHYLAALVEKRQHKGMTLEKAETALQDNVTFACMMVSEGDADGCVAGAITPTAEVVRNAMRYVGKQPDAALVSSCFVMLMQPGHPVPGAMVIGDCALVIDPDPEELASIAVSTGDTAVRLLGIEPELGMLSFSTMGSAKHSSVSKVSIATAAVRKQRPRWRVVGEVQLDAAVVPDILQKKAPAEATDSPCNVLIFPDLNAGNIGYKLIERFGGAQAIGPILQGLNKPVNDLSRGCSTDDIINIIAVSAAQAS
ncbi:MAG: phosphate acetyltransferase [Granulosicoccus sp.]